MDLVVRQVIMRDDVDCVPNRGVAPLGWISQPEQILIDQALNDYEVVWAASGHQHAVYPTTYDELIQCTGAQPMIVGD